MLLEMVATAESKRALVAQILEKLRAEIATMDRAARAAREAATHEEAKPENDKDTRALEASYLAGAQAERVRELEAAVKFLEGMEVRSHCERVSAAAIVTVRDDSGEESRYFVAPHGGGMKLSHDGAGLVVITPQSPLGRALLGRVAGDVVEHKGEVEIVDVE